jgi:hypothetical protein
MRYLGGLALEYDVNARFTTGFHVGGRHNGEGYFAPYLLVDAGEKDVDASVDIFLEQTRNEAAAGIVVRAGDARNMQRFLLQAKGPAVEARIDAVVDGQRTEEERWLIPTIKRGFTLRVVAVGDNFSYWIDGAEVKRLRRSQYARGTGVGVVNGGGESSRFDNLEVKHCR